MSLPSPKKKLAGYEFDTDKRVFKGKMPAIVVSNRDPLYVGRVRVRIPGLHEEGLSEEHYPWAYPNIPVYSGIGVWCVPQPGSWVWVSFLEDDEILIYEGTWLKPGEGSLLTGNVDTVVIYKDGAFIYVDSNHIRISAGGATIGLCSGRVHIFGDLVVHGQIYGPKPIGGGPSMNCTIKTNPSYEAVVSSGTYEAFKEGEPIEEDYSAPGCQKFLDRNIPPPTCDNRVFEHLTEEQMLALTLWGEAGYEPIEGIIAVGFVILNRKKLGLWGNTIKHVVLAPKQFSMYNCTLPQARARAEQIARHFDEFLECKKRFRLIYQIAKDLLEGKITQDPSKGATHYHADYVSPRWANPDKLTAKIGRHIFYKLI